MQDLVSDASGLGVVVTRTARPAAQVYVGSAGQELVSHWQVVLGLATAE